MTQEEAFEALKMGYNVFLTGPAGSGKTFLLQKRRDFKRRRCRKSGNQPNSYSPRVGHNSAQKLLSRLRSLNGLKLTGINEMSFMVNKAVAEADKKLKQESKKFIEELKTAGAAEKSVKQKDFLNRLPGSAKIKCKIFHQIRKF